MNGAGGVDLEGSLSVQTLGDSLLGVVVLSEMEEAGWYAWGQWSRTEGSPGLAPLAAPFRWECLIGKVFCLGCKQSWVRVGLEALGSESGSFGCVSSYQVVGNRNLLLWLFF